MAERTRRVGLLKAVGGTPGLVAVVLLAENLVLALVAAAAGLAIGWLADPLITNPGPAWSAPPARRRSPCPSSGGGGRGPPGGAGATFVPAIRAARTSTVSALARRGPHGRGAGPADRVSRAAARAAAARAAAGRPAAAPRLLGAVSIAVTVMGIVAVLTFHATADQRLSGRLAGWVTPCYARDEQMLIVVTVVLVALSVINAVVATGRRSWTPGTRLRCRARSAPARSRSARGCRRRRCFPRAGRHPRRPAGHLAVRGR